MLDSALDTASSVADTAVGVLGGGASSAAGKGTPKYFRGEVIDDSAAPRGGAAAPEGSGSGRTATPFNKPSMIEWVHFNRRHEDKATSFSHAVGTPGRAIRFRDALERESLLLYGFVRALKAQVDDYEASQGLLGDVANIAETAFGSGSSGPDPKAELSKLMKTISSAGTPVNVESVTYKDLHKFAVDLAQARADWQVLSDTLKQHYIEKKDSGPKAMITSVPGIPGAVKTVLGFVFKPLDISMAMLFAVREEYEDGIETACYNMTIDSINNRKLTTFSPWFTPPPTSASAPAGGGGSGLPGALGKAVDDAKAAVDSAVDKVDEFLNVRQPPDPAQGQEFLDQVFKLFEGTPQDAPGDKRMPDGSLRARKKLGETLRGAICSALGVSSLPGPMPRIVDELVGGIIEVTKRIYTASMADGLQRPLSKMDVYETQREMLIDKIFDTLFQLVSFLNQVKQSNIGVQGKTYGPGGLIGKAKEELNEAIGDKIEPVLAILAGHLCDKLEIMRSKSAEKKNLTMEVYLSALPEIIVMQTRNILCPIFDMIMEKLFPEVMKYLNMAAKPLGPVVDTAKDVTRKVKEGADKAKALKNLWDTQGLQAGSGGQNISQYQNIVNATPADPFGSGGGAGGGGGGYPGDMRELEVPQGQSSTLQDAAGAAASMAGLGGGDAPADDGPDVGAARVETGRADALTKSLVDEVKAEWVKVED